MFYTSALLIANWFSGRGTPTLVPSAVLERIFQLPLPPRSKSSIDEIRISYAIHLHVHYIDEAIVILNSICGTCPGADLYITYSKPLVHDCLDSHCKAIGLYKTLNHHAYIRVHNHGRNVAPLLNLVENTLYKYPVALHLHTKKSPHFGEGNRWSNHLTSCLVQDKMLVNAVLSGFIRDSQLGLVMPTAFTAIRPYLGWGSNLQLAKSLAIKLDPPIFLSKAMPLLFPAGMMFWFRPAIFRNLAKVYRSSSISLSEPLPQDGTILHAVERLLVYVCESRGFNWAYISPGVYDKVDQANPSIRKFSVLTARPVQYKIILVSQRMDNFIRKTRSFFSLLLSRASARLSRFI
jgi:lipopolysaccharide biosynthesis protein